MSSLNVLFKRTVCSALCKQQLIYLFLFSLLPTSLISGEYDEFFEMSLVELVNVKITSTALMEVDNQLIPVQVSVINKEHIRVSGARSLDELLEIFVPSFIYLNKGNTGNSLGFRGIISDRNNKTLLLVNGKVMNHKSLQGALSERFITMLGDIERVEVIQSPQSSIYGPGAINAVINIFTKDGKDDQPLHISATQSIINKTTTIELRHSKKISDKLSYALYYGGDYAQGIDASKAPVKIGYGGDIIFKGDTLGSFTADQAHSYPANDLYAYGSHSDDLIDKIRHKAHAQIDYGNWQSWIRFTKGGEDRVPPQNMLTKKDPRETGINFLGYTQISAMSSFDHYFNDMIGIDARVGYDIQDIISIAKDSAWVNPNPKFKNNYAPIENQEREFHSRALLKINHDLFSIAIGPAITYETYGLPVFNSDDAWRVSGDLNSTKLDSVGQEEYGESWSTTMFSAIGELQIHPHKNVNLLFGLRSDKHDYTQYMHSPRASVVWAANDWSLYRVNYSRSNRRNDETDLRVDYIDTKRDQGVVETIDYIEISPEFKPIKNLTVKPTIYGALYNPVGWVWTRGEETLGKTMDLGNVKYAGVELSAEYRNRNHHIRGSHSYIRILESNLLKRENNIFITAMEYGYGNSFTDFPDHISKLYYSYSINNKFNVQSSLQAYWKFQGAIDASHYNSDSLNSNQAYTMESKSEKAFGPTVNLNLGGSYKLPYNFTMRLNMYNLLNLINEDLSKRNEFQRMSMYRIEPFSLSLNVTYSL